MADKDTTETETQKPLTPKDPPPQPHPQAPRKTSSADHGHGRRVSGGKHIHGGGGLEREDGVQILEVTEKHGSLYNAIPCMPLPLAIVCCVVNIVVPGLGTFVSAWTTLCGCKTRVGSPAKALGLNLVAALLQMITFVLIVGWVWSIIWGMNFVQIATTSKEEKKRDPATELLE